MSLASAPYDVITGPSDQISPEQCASDILRCHYATLSQSLHDPIGVARLLYHEDSTIITEETLTSIEAIGRSEESERVTVLLKVVRRAVHVSHRNLEMFANVLKRFPKNVLLANSILTDYSRLFIDYVIIVMILLLLQRKCLKQLYKIWILQLVEVYMCVCVCV